MIPEHWIQIAVNAALAAGNHILEVYDTPFTVEQKIDDTPVTRADKEADQIIQQFLSQTSAPVMSEEGRPLSWAERQHEPYLWIVDPIDGTKEFIQKNGQFSVNIALVHQGQPVLGIITQPTAQKGWIGVVNQGAKAWVQLPADCANWQDIPGFDMPFHPGDGHLKIARSRSHRHTTTDAYIARLDARFPHHKHIVHGSSIKLCMVATGEADMYPRWAEINEWDVAAGHAIIRSAGGTMIDPHTALELTYNKPEPIVSGFIACRQNFSQLFGSNAHQW